MQMLANGGIYNGKRIMGSKTIELMRTNGLDEIAQRDFEDTYNAGYGYGYGVRTLIDKEKAIITARSARSDGPAALAPGARRTRPKRSRSYICTI